MNINMQQINAFNSLNNFLDFAQASENGDVIAKFNGGTGKVTTAEGDRIKGLFTWTAPGRDVDANNATRNAFKDSLLALFDKKNVDELPKTVRNVLKAGDYDNTGRPLSARRINAVMTAVKDTEAYQRTESYAKLSNYMKEQFTLATGALDNDVALDQVKADMKTFVDKAMSSRGGGFKNLLIDIAGDAKIEGLHKGVQSFLVGIGQALENGGTFVFTTGKDTDERLAPWDLRVVEGIRTPNKSSVDVNYAMDQHFKACRKNVIQSFAEENPDLKAADRDEILKKVFKELDKIADRIKIRMAALMNIDILPGDTNKQKIENFELEIARIRRESPFTIENNPSIELAVLKFRDM